MRKTGNGRFPNPNTIQKPTRSESLLFVPTFNAVLRERAAKEKASSIKNKNADELNRSQQLARTPSAPHQNKMGLTPGIPSSTSYSLNQSFVNHGSSYLDTTSASRKKAVAHVQKENPTPETLYEYVRRSSSTATKRTPAKGAQTPARGVASVARVRLQQGNYWDQVRNIIDTDTESSIRREEAQDSSLSKVAPNSTLKTTLKPHTHLSQSPSSLRRASDAQPTTPLRSSSAGKFRLTDPSRNQQTRERHRATTPQPTPSRAPVTATKQNTKISTSYPTKFVRAALKNFPKHGLKYSGKHDASDETLYKKDLRKIVESGVDAQSFAKSLELELGGIYSLLRNPEQLQPKNPFQRTFDSPQKTNTRNNISLIKSLVLTKNSRNFSKKISNLISAVEAASDPEKLYSEIKGASDSDLRVARLLYNFFTENASKINLESKFKENSTPFVFFKYALQAELFLIEKQSLILEGSSTQKTKSAIPNIQFLDRDPTATSKVNMLAAIENKRDNFVLPTYREKLAHPKTAATAQFNQLKSAEAMNIALKDPATRPFEWPRNLEFSIHTNKDDILSEEQYSTLQSLKDALTKEGKDGMRGQFKVRMRTGGGKTRVLKSIQGNVINLDLNSPLGYLEQLEIGDEDIKNKIICADELFFYDLPPLTNEADGKLKYSKNTGRVIDNASGSEPNAIAKRQYDFLYNLRKKGAVVATVGASESLSKISHECGRISNKITAKIRDLSSTDNKEIIKNANSFIYGINSKATRYSQPVLLEITPETALRQDTAKWNEPAVYNGDKKSAIGIKASGRPMSNREFLVTTAYHLKELCRFWDGAADNQQFIELATALTPLSATYQRDFNWKTKKHLSDQGIDELGQLLQIAKVPTTHQTRISTALSSHSLPLAPLNQAVRNFLTAEIDSETHTTILRSLPSDKENLSSKTNTDLDKLKDRLEFREFQLEDLRQRRDVTTMERLRATELRATASEESLHDSIFRTLSELPQESKSKKIHYVLPDFEITTSIPGVLEANASPTFDDDFLHRILTSGIAGYIVLPHKKDGDQLQCRLLLEGDTKKGESRQNPEDFPGFTDFNGILSSVIKIEDLDKYLSSTESTSAETSVLSFFDKTNSIGGDYGCVSVNITTQITQLTQTECLSGFKALTADNLMQYNRDRSDPDDVSEVAKPILILPSVALLQYSIPLPSAESAMPEEFVTLIKNNTTISDKFRLHGYLQSKHARDQKHNGLPSEVAPTTPPKPKYVEVANFQVLSEQVSERKNAETEERQIRNQELLDKLGARTALFARDNPHKDSEPLIEACKEATEEVEQLLFQGYGRSASTTSHTTAFSAHEDHFEENVEEQDTPTTAVATTAPYSPSERLQNSKLFLTPVSSSPIAAVLQTLTQKDSSILKSAEYVQYILPDFDAETFTLKDLKNILDTSKAEFIVIPWKKNETENLQYRVICNGKSDLVFAGCSEEELPDALSGLMSYNKNSIIIRFIDKKNFLEPGYKDSFENVSRQYVHMTEDSCPSMLRDNFSNYYDCSPNSTSRELVLRLIMPEAAFTQIVPNKNFSLPANNAMPQELVNFICQTHAAAQDFDEEESSTVLTTTPTNLLKPFNQTYFTQFNSKTVAKKEVPSGSPLTSTKNPRIHQLTQRYFSELGQENIFTKRGKDRNQFKVITSVYADAEDSELLITRTMLGIVLYSALNAKINKRDAAPLSSTEVAEAIKIATYVGSISLFFANPSTYQNLDIQDIENKKVKYPSFSKIFQETCKSCGILSDDKEEDPNKMTGLRASNIPLNVINAFEGIRSKIGRKNHTTDIESGQSDLAHYLTEALRRISPRQEQMEKVLRNFNSQSSESSIGR